MTVLLPAAGFGKRNPDWPVKELMLHDGEAIIAKTFRHLGSPIVEKVVIITRREKLPALEEWLEAFKKSANLKTDVQWLLHEPGNSEWPHTLLASEKMWSAKNLVLLPDTDLQTTQGTPIEIFDRSLDGHPTVWAVKEKPLEEVKSFGNVEVDGQRALRVIEKPIRPRSPFVWGCFGFQKAYGQRLLHQLATSTKTHRGFDLPPDSLALPLASFDDLSRA